eukprot:6360294-Pyramimonas_sp.AAC.1
MKEGAGGGHLSRSRAGWQCWAPLRMAAAAPDWALPPRMNYICWSLVSVRDPKANARDRARASRGRRGPKIEPLRACAGPRPVLPLS